MPSSIVTGDLQSPHLPAPVPYAVLTPKVEGLLPLCIFLLGAGGSRDMMLDLQPLFDSWWAEGSVPPMRVAIPSGGMDYYLEDPAGPLHWDSFLVDDFVPHLQTPGTPVVLAGISGGGYGALKLGFARPGLFAAVAAMQPMLEPAFRESDVRARNRLHHTAGGPPQLIGPSRDATLWEANNPANRARANAQAIRDADLPIYLDAADRDFLNAHDGAEFLHRVLWELDVSHEYRLVRGADHGGPTQRPRLRAMFEWLGAQWLPPAVDEASEARATLWLEGGMQGKPPAGATATNAFISFLRGRFEPLREKASAADPSARRRLGTW